MRIHAKLCRVKRRQMLSHERRDDARQNVPRAAGRHAGIAGRVLVNALAIGDERAVPFKYDDQFLLGGELDGQRLPIRLHVGRVRMYQAGKLSRMRRHDARPRFGGEFVEMSDKRVEPVGVDHHWLGDFRYQLEQQRAISDSGKPPRTDRMTSCAFGEGEQPATPPGRRGLPHRPATRPSCNRDCPRQRRQNLRGHSDLHQPLAPLVMPCRTAPRLPTCRGCRR